jgi:hypothetical protein
MPETNAEKAIRFRREADATELRGKQIMNIAVLLVNGRHYDKAVSDAKALLAKAIALRGLADRLQSEGRIDDPVDSN